MHKVRVLTPGLLTTVQDEGRRGYQRFGVPVAGVFDTYAAAVANWLVGNAASAAVLEATFLGPTLQTQVPLQAAITGGTVQATLDGEPVPLWQSFAWQPEQELAVGSVAQGARVYLAVSGGWQVPLVMGSRSTYVRAALGGQQGRQLTSGDELPVQPAVDFRQRRLPRAFWPPLSQTKTLRFVPGPQTDHFPADAVQLLQENVYEVDPASDRMGIRLRGAEIAPLQPDIISDAIAYGSIQIPRSGQPIVMGPDRQTTGGYPKIGTVVSVDMCQLAQARPGDTVRWQAVSVEAAQKIVRRTQQQLQIVQDVVDKKIKGREYRVQVDQSTFYSFAYRQD